MKIQLNKDFRIGTIPMNFVLEKSRVVDDEKSKNHGKTMWDVVGYYGKLPDALDGFLRHSMLGSDADGMDEVKVLLRDVAASVRQVKDELKELVL